MSWISIAQNLGYSIGFVISGISWFIFFSSILTYDSGRASFFEEESPSHEKIRFGSLFPASSSSNSTATSAFAISQDCAKLGTLITIRCAVRAWICSSRISRFPGLPCKSFTRIRRFSFSLRSLSKSLSISLFDLASNSNCVV